MKSVNRVSGKPILMGVLDLVHGFIGRKSLRIRGSWKVGDSYRLTAPLVIGEGTVGELPGGRGDSFKDGSGTRRTC